MAGDLLNGLFSLIKIFNKLNLKYCKPKNIHLLLIFCDFGLVKIREIKYSLNNTMYIAIFVEMQNY